MPKVPLQDVADLCSSGSAFAALQMDGTVRRGAQYVLPVLQERFLLHA